MENKRLEIILLDILKSDCSLDINIYSNISVNDWKLLYELAHSQYVSNLFYYKLKEKGFEIYLDDSLKKEIKDFFHKSTLRNLLLQVDFIALVKEMNKENISVATLKGIELAFKIYPTG